MINEHLYLCVIAPSILEMLPLSGVSRMLQTHLCFFCLKELNQLPALGSCWLLIDSISGVGWREGRDLPKQTGGKCFRVTALCLPEDLWTRPPHCGCFHSSRLTAEQAKTGQMCVAVQDCRVRSAGPKTQPRVSDCRNRSFTSLIWLSFHSCLLSEYRT